MASGKGKLCVECQQRRKDITPVMKHVNGTIDYICQSCWIRLHYNLYMEPREGT